MLGLPTLEAFEPRRARATSASTPPFAIFFRQANGVAAAQTTEELGMEPERFWPRTAGALDAANVEGRAIEVLSTYLDRILVVHGVNMRDFEYGDGHARGALQLLTAQGPTVIDAGGDSEAGGESLDHRIGRELNPDGRDSLFMYAGQNSGWLGGACISYRGPANRRSALNNPWNAYQTLVGGAEGGLSNEAAAALAVRQESVNDLVREELQTLLSRPELGMDDRRRLELHLSSVRDVETAIMCQLEDDRIAALEGVGQTYGSTNGDEVLATARLHMDVAALAIACGYTRSVAIQVGNGNDGLTRYRDPDSGDLMENYHYISHRRLSHDSTGTVILGSDLLHHKIDRQFGDTFKYLLDRLDAYVLPEGTLLDAGIAVWLNDLGNGPAHSRQSVPFVIAGGAGGYLQRGNYVMLPSGDNHARMLNTLGTAVGLRSSSGDPIDDFGDPSLDHSLLDEIIA